MKRLSFMHVASVQRRCALALVLLAGVSGVCGQGLGTGFQPADANHDDVVERSEHDAFVQKDFEAADTDHDGRLSRAELRAWLVRNAAAHKTSIDAGALERTTAGLLQSMDCDRDGFVSFAEHKKKADLSFERLDRNKDGRLTREEIPGTLAPAGR